MTIQTVYASTKFSIITSTVIAPYPNNHRIVIRLSDLAIDYKLLQALNLVSLYAESFSLNKYLRISPPATKDYAIKFLIQYLEDFNKTELNATSILLIDIWHKDVSKQVEKATKWLLN